MFQRITITIDLNEDQRKHFEDERAIGQELSVTRELSKEIHSVAGRLIDDAVNGLRGAGYVVEVSD